MKKVSFIAALFLIVTSCASVRVNSDYDKKVDFSNYKTYAFLKAGIDKMEVSDLDKKRIMHSVEDVMAIKGFTKSDTPDLLINLFTNEREQVDVNQFNAGWGYSWGYGWNPYFWGGHTAINRYTEGTLFIDLIDAKKKELIWQGEGEGALTKDTHKKDAMVKEFVTKILEQYPPTAK